MRGRLGSKGFVRQYTELDLVPCKDWKQLTGENVIFYQTDYERSESLIECAIFLVSLAFKTFRRVVVGL